MGIIEIFSIKSVLAQGNHLIQHYKCHQTEEKLGPGIKAQWLTCLTFNRPWFDSSATEKRELGPGIHIGRKLRDRMQEGGEIHKPKREPRTDPSLNPSEEAAF